MRVTAQRYPSSKRLKLSNKTWSNCFCFTEIFSLLFSHLPRGHRSHLSFGLLSRHQSSLNRLYTLTNHIYINVTAVRKYIGTWRAEDIFTHIYIQHCTWDAGYCIIISHNVVRIQSSFEIELACIHHILSKNPYVFPYWFLRHLMWWPWSFFGCPIARADAVSWYC